MWIPWEDTLRCSSWIMFGNVLRTVEPSFKSHHKTPPKHRIERLICDAGELDEFVELEPFPADQLHHFGDNGIRESTCNGRTL